ncbi:hypothetical protein, partial [Nostoc sp. UHCC 0251]|uniref:hypothetical protein n=1 Tax=Nostoc sp. UHCC 0251 TaxID=3110240 RepID=UPI002B20CF09
LRSLRDATQTRSVSQTDAPHSLLPQSVTKTSSGHRSDHRINRRRAFVLVLELYKYAVSMNVSFFA